MATNDMWNDDWRWIDSKTMTSTGEGPIYASARSVTHGTSEATMDVSNRHTRETRRSAHDALIAMDAGGLITDWNFQAEVTFGWPRREVLGRELAATVICEGHREAHRGGIERLLAAGHDPVLVNPLELTALHRDGREFPIELTIAAVETEEGYSFNAFVRERRQFVEVPAIGTFGSWEWDIAAGTIDWSEELCRIYGVEPGSQLSFEEFLALIHPDDRDLMQTTVQTAYETCQPYSIEHRVVRPDGVVRVLHGRGEVIVDDAGRPLRMFGTGQDMTERRRPH